MWKSSFISKKLHVAIIEILNEFIKLKYFEMNHCIQLRYFPILRHLCAPKMSLAAISSILSLVGLSFSYSWIIILITVNSVALHFQNYDKSLMSHSRLSNVMRSKFCLGHIVFYLHTLKLHINLLGVIFWRFWSIKV